MTESVFMCAIFRNEALYLKEWLEFHLLVGVERFVLYQNNSDDDYHHVLDPYVEQGVVELVEWPLSNPSQAAAYMDCIKRYQGRRVWIGFCDCDEFLWSPEYDSLPWALEELLRKGIARSAFGVNWMVFGSGGQMDYEARPVIERFTWRPFPSHPVNQHIKSLIWMGEEAGPIATGSDPHYFRVSGGTFNELGQPILGPHSQHSSSVLRINHYSSKSLAEWRKRILLGKPDRAGVEVREDEWYWDRQQQDVDDRGEDSIQRYLPVLRERLGLD